NTFLLVPLSLVFVLPPLGGFGIIYLATASLLGLGMILVDLRLVANPTKAQAWTAFKFSSPYLAIVFLAMVLDVKLLPHYLPIYKSSAFRAAFQNGVNDDASYRM